MLGIYLFGSWDTEGARADSDIDLAVLPVGPLDTVQRWELAQELAIQAGRDVDLVDLLAANTVMRAQVVAYGRRLYCADSSRCDEFEDRAFSAYAHLNEERREILRDIQQRGSVYG